MNTDLSSRMYEVLRDVGGATGPRWYTPTPARRKTTGATYRALLKRGLVERSDRGLVLTRAGMLVVDAWHAGLSRGRVLGMIEQREKSRDEEEP